MNIKVGDKVRYLNDVGGGVVTKIISNTLVEIKDESGFNIPVSKSELVLIESASENFVQKDEPISEGITLVEGNDSPELLFAIVPANEKLQDFELYLINDSNLFVSYVCAENNNSNLNLIEQGIIEPNTKLLLSEYSLSDLHFVPAVSVQVLYFSKDLYSEIQPISENVRIPHKKLHTRGAFIENDFFNEDALVFSIYNAKKQAKHLPVDANMFHEKIQEDSVVKKSAQAKSSKEETREVDLHIHELIDDECGMTPFDKLELQIKTFEVELGKAMKEGAQKIVFIHGVGNGILKSKICSVLDKDYPHLFYQDASFQKYKFGATLVYLRKIKR